MRHMPGRRHPPRVPRLARAGRPVVAQLSAAGMSTRAIAPVVGRHHDTVASDIRAARVGNPTPAPAEPAEATELEETPAQPEPPAAPTTVTGRPLG